MKRVFKEITNSVIALSILSILLGIVLIVWPGMTLAALGIAVGASLIVHGITLIALDIRARKLYVPYEGMLQGILDILLGVILIWHPVDLAIWLAIAVGIWVIVSSVNNIKTAVSLKGEDAPWVLMVIINVIDIFIGCAIIFSPLVSSISITVCIGIVLIVHSIIHLADMIMLKHDARTVENLIKEKRR